MEETTRNMPPGVDEDALDLGFDLLEKQNRTFTDPPAARAATTTNAAPTLPRSVSIADLPLVPRKRQWLHGNDLMRGAVSMIVAPGARAKTTWLIACALACASGRPILGAKVFGGPLRILYLSAEDGSNEIALRVRGAMQHHALRDIDVPGFHVIGAERWEHPLLDTATGSPKIHEKGRHALVAELEAINPDVLFIDPLINVMGGVDANNNSAAAVLMGQLVSLATMRNMAIIVAHHASKGRDPKSPESAMGAASFVNLSRIVLSIEPLAGEHADRLGLPTWESSSVFRIVGTKQNYRPPDREDRWFRLRSSAIPNEDPPTYPNGDQVAVVEEFHPGASGAEFARGLIRDALKAIATAVPPLSPSPQATTRFAVPVIAQAIAPHRGGRADDMEGKNVLNHLIRSNLVRVEYIKLSRAEGRSDARKGLTLTSEGEAVLQKESTAAEPGVS
jgi:hypothetical protein